MRLALIVPAENLASKNGKAIQAIAGMKSGRYRDVKDTNFFREYEGGDKDLRQINFMLETLAADRAGKDLELTLADVLIDLSKV